MMDAGTFAEATNERLTEHTKFADAKAGAILSLVGLVGAAMAVAASPVLGALHHAPLVVRVTMVVTGLMVALGVAVAVGFCLVAIFPRTQTSDSLRSFADIARDGGSDYADKVATATPEDLLRSVCLHNVALARIADAKFRATSRAVRAMAVAVYGAYIFMLVYGLSLATAQPGAAETAKDARLACSYDAGSGNIVWRCGGSSTVRGE